MTQACSTYAYLKKFIRRLEKHPWRVVENIENDMATLKIFLQYYWLQLDKTKNKWKIFYKEITKKETRKYSTSTYLIVLSNRTVKKESGGGGHRRKNWIYIFKAKERKQYQSNGTENLFVVIIYFI